MYGIFDKNGKFRLAKRFIITDTETIINPTDEIYEMHGYKKVIEEEPPILLENQGAKVYYEETDDAILKRYEVVEIEDNEDFVMIQEKATAYDILMGVSE